MNQPLYYSSLLVLGLLFSCFSPEKSSAPAASPTMPRTAEPAPPTETPAFDAVERAVLDEVNALRATGCRCPGGKRFPPAPALRWNDQLANAAQAHAKDMQRNKFFDHRGSDGADFSARVTRAGYRWKTVAENIADGYPDAKSVVLGWRNSKGHCKNLMNSDFREMGAARAGRFWVQTLATQR